MSMVNRPLLNFEVTFDLGNGWKIVSGRYCAYDSDAAIETAKTVLFRKHPQFADYKFEQISARQVK